MIIEPFGQRLIVKRLSEKERSGIMIPKDSVLAKGSLVGQVIHAGEQAEFVKVGDTILFAKYSGDPLPVDGKFLDATTYEDCLVMNEDNILGRLTEKEPNP